MRKKVRIDKLLFEKGLAPSRERAQSYIMSGNVLANEQKIEKPGIRVFDDVVIRVKGFDQPYVSRGGLKLEKALDAFNIPVNHLIAMDVGASTGGFTDCLLQRGASYVYAIDVGYGQLAWKLVSDTRVKNMERTNFRHMSFSKIGTYVDLIVIDVSFISLTKILEHCLLFLIKGGVLIALIKPQFEAGKENIEKRGVVVKHGVRAKVIESIRCFAEKVGFAVEKIEDSPIQGKKSGNMEYLILLRKR